MSYENVPVIRRATVTPILIADPPLLNVQGVHQPYTPRTIVEIETSDGATGVGETYGDPAFLNLAREFASDVVGQPLTAANVVRWHNVVPGTSEKVRASVASAFEVACLDALGKHVGLPVHALLGGKVRDTVEYSAYLFYKWESHPSADAPADDWGAALDPDGIVKQARRFTDLYGFSSYKLKGGVFPPEEEIAAIRALAAAFPDRPLRLDPNGGWSVETSVRVAESLSGVLEYLEDPTLGVAGMSEVHRRTGVILATNMCVTAFSEIPSAFAASAVQVVLSDHHYWGGLLATRDLAAVCRTYGVGLSMHSNTHLGISLAAMTHVASTVPELLYACDTHRPWQTDDIITTPHTFVDGCLAVSDAPGLGIELDRSQLALLHDRWLHHEPMRSRDDAAAMRLADPSWQSPSLPRW
jgi:glucarate dehydratase